MSISWLATLKLLSMARNTTALTDFQISKAKPREKQYKLFDGGGLFLIVAPNGGKWWRLKYRIQGKEKLISLGTYPDTPLSDARKHCDTARKQLAQGINPAEAQKQQKAAQVESALNSFEHIAKEWISKQNNCWSDENTKIVTRLLNANVFPAIGDRPISEIKAPEVLSVLRKLEERGVLKCAQRVRTICSQAFRYAIAIGKTERDPAADLRGALAVPKKNHFAAVTDPKAVGLLLRAIDNLSGTHIVKSAMQLAPLVFVRPGELRHAEWDEINFEEEIWSIPADKMKMKIPHLVPLSRQAILILRGIQPATGSSQYVFHSARSKNEPMSDMALLTALRRMGYSKGQMTPHGFRAMARTLIDEVLQIRPDFIEHQLAHAVRDPNGRAYNRTAHLEERRKMMQRWADYLDELKGQVN